MKKRSSKPKYNSLPKSVAVVKMSMPQKKTATENFGIGKGKDSCEQPNCKMY